MTSVHQSGVRETRITARSGDLLLYLRELYESRELLTFLVWKDIKVQFAETVLGLGWLVLRPLLNVLILTLVFGKIAKLPSDGAPYMLFALSGMLPWSYFSGCVGKASMSLVGNSALVTKIYFPRVYMPVSVAISGLAEFAVTFTIFIALSVLLYHRSVSFGLLGVLVPLSLLLFTTIGASLWLAALAVQFRDVRYASQYLLQMLMFAAPIIWPLSMLPARLGANSDAVLGWYSLYPLVGVVEGFRHALLGSGEMPWNYLAHGFASALLLSASGILYFRHREQRLADIL